MADLCEPLDLPVLGWHGDVGASRKAKFLEHPSGVLILTPESLEALFVNKGSMIPSFASAVRYIVIDEPHSFMDAERGKQVESQMARLELAAGHRLPRVGLSATLGDKMLAAEYLRPGNAAAVRTIDGENEGLRAQTDRERLCRRMAETGEGKRLRAGAGATSRRSGRCNARG